jgi:isoquinoline 1-oxidoreductase beta subunit
MNDEHAQAPVSKRTSDRYRRESLLKVIAEAAARGKGATARDDGDVDGAFADAPSDKVIETEYRVPYLAHAPMEPVNCTAQLADGRLTLWAPNQTRSQTFFLPQ